MSREWADAVGIVTSLGLATGGYQIQKRCHTTAEDSRPGEFFSISMLLKAAGDFLLCAGVLLALVLAGILIAGH